MNHTELMLAAKAAEGGKVALLLSRSLMRSAGSSSDTDMAAVMLPLLMTAHQSCHSTQHIFSLSLCEEGKR